MQLLGEAQVTEVMSQLKAVIQLKCSDVMYVCDHDLKLLTPLILLYVQHSTAGPVPGDQMSVPSPCFDTCVDSIEVALPMGDSDSTCV